MAQHVRTAGGATEAEPCPTEIGRWFTRPWCSAADFNQWREAVGALYDGGLVPLYEQVRQLDTAQGNHQASQVAYTALDRYRMEADQLPAQGSQLSANENLSLVTRAMAIMVMGENAIAMMRASVEQRGAVPVAMALPQVTAPVERKPAWQRYLLPGLVAAGGVAIAGLTIAAVADRSR